MDKHEMLITTLTWKIAYQNLSSEPKGKKNHCLDPSVEYCLSSFSQRRKKKMQQIK